MRLKNKALFLLFLISSHKYMHKHVTHIQYGLSSGRITKYFWRKGVLFDPTLFLFWVWAFRAFLSCFINLRHVVRRHLFMLYRCKLMQSGCIFLPTCAMKSKYLFPPQTFATEEEFPSGLLSVSHKKECCPSLWWFSFWLLLHGLEGKPCQNYLSWNFWKLRLANTKNCYFFGDPDVASELLISDML